MSMRTIIFFTIVVVTGSTMSGDNNFCEQCYEYLGNCCKKEGEGEEKNENNVGEKEKDKEKEEEEEKEVQEEFYLKRLEQDDSEEIKKLVSTNWYEAKKETASFILYEKIDNIVDVGLNDNNVIKIKKDKNGFSIDENFILEKDNTKKWALFEIIYKEEKEEGKEEKTVYLYCSDIEKSKIYGIFDSCKQHISISVIACDTSGVTDMSDMFGGCSSLTKLNLSEFDTKNVTDMAFMFCDCSSLTELDLSNFNTETVTCMCAMFSGCAYLQQLDLTNFNTGNVTDMDNMFLGCKALTELDLSNFNTNKVINMVIMFSECSSLQTVTFNKNLNNKIIDQLGNLGFKDEPQEIEGNKFVWTKN